jgi:hypothetical protein
LSLSWLTPLSLVLPLPGLLRLLTVLGFSLVVPGAALVCRLRIDDRVVEWGLAITGSLVVFASGAVLMAWTGWWQPHVLLTGVALASGLPLWAELRDRSTGTSPSPER